MKRVSFVLAVMFILLFSIAASAEDVTASSNMIKEDTESMTVAAHYPVFSGFKAADQLNEFVKDKLTVALEYVEDMRKEDIQYGDKRCYGFYNVYAYGVADDLLSYCQLVSTYLGGTHPGNVLESMTIDMNSGQVYQFRDLFKDEKAYQKAVELLCDKVMNFDGLFEDSLKEVKEAKEYNYCLSGGEVVVYFNEYDIAPYASGRPQFVFTPDELKDLLQEDIYQKLVAMPKESAGALNGRAMHFENEIVAKDGTGVWLPLAEVSKMIVVEEKVLKTRDVKMINNIEYVNLDNIGNSEKSITVNYGEDHPKFYIFKPDKIVTPAEFLAK